MFHDTMKVDVRLISVSYNSSSKNEEKRERIINGTTSGAGRVQGSMTRVISVSRRSTKSMIISNGAE